MQNGDGRLGRRDTTNQRLGAIWNGVIWGHSHHQTKHRGAHVQRMIAISCFVAFIQPSPQHNMNRMRHPRTSHEVPPSLISLQSKPIYSRLHFRAQVYNATPRFEFHQSFRRERDGDSTRRGDEKFAASPFLATSFASGLASFGLVAVAPSSLPFRRYSWQQPTTPKLLGGG